jgi:hypothetical protein
LIENNIGRLDTCESKSNRCLTAVLGCGSVGVAFHARQRSTQRLPDRPVTRDQEDFPVGQKTVRFSDLSGQLITGDEAPARIVVREHPALPGGPVEIEALAGEARDIEKAAGQVAVLDLYFPGEDQPRRVAMDAEAFGNLATDAPMSQVLASARPARRAPRSRATTEPAAAELAAAKRAAAEPVTDAA